MDFTSSLKSDFFRPLTITIIPGAIAFGPYILIIAYYFPMVSNFWNEHPYGFTAILVITIIAVGLMLENIGASVEAHLWDNLLEKKNPGHLDNWKNYLKLCLDDEIIAHRYLKKLVAKMKFELSMGPALVIFLLGLLWIDYIRGIFTGASKIAIILSFLLLIVLIIRESYVTARLLGNIRSLILEAITQTTSKPNPSI